jgi:hypothetical protein
MRPKRMVPIGVALLASLAVAVPAQAAIGEAEALTAASAQAYAKGMNTGSIEVSSPGAAPYGRARAVFGAEGGSVNPLDETAYTFLFPSHTGTQSSPPNISDSSLGRLVARSTCMQGLPHRRSRPWGLS